MKLLIVALCMFFSGLVFAKDYTVKVNGMVCSFCVQGIQKNLKKIEGLDKVEVSLETKLVKFSSEKEVSKEDVTKAIENAGYSVVEFIE